MSPRDPPKNPQFGFLYLPPLRIQGYSIAGQETLVQVPELGVGFDIGRCPPQAVASRLVALSHCHMDHVAGVGYYFSQRRFQGCRLVSPRAGGAAAGAHDRSCASRGTTDV